MNHTHAGHSPEPRRTLGAGDIKTLALSALGGTLEYYDFVIYVFFATVIGAVFFPPHMSDGLREIQTFGVFAAGYLARPLGGVVFGHFADKLGRKRMFTLSVLLMAVPTLLIAFLPTYAVAGLAAPLLLLLMRVLQGTAVGGELTGSWVFVGEHVPARHYGLGLGVLTAGLTGGILLGSLVSGAINAHFTPAEVHTYGWRLAFALGGVFGLVSVYLRRYLSETPVYKALQAQRRTARELPLRAVLREHRGALLYIAAQTWVLSAAVGVVLLLTPVYLQKLYGLPASQALAANSAATLAVLAGCVFAGWLSDRIGVARVMFGGWAGLLASSYLLYTGLPSLGASGSPAHWLTLHYALAGLFVGTIATVPIVSVRAFPAAIRSTGLSFGYNIAYAVFGGLTPMFVSLLMHHDAMAPAHYVGALCVLGMACALLPLSRHGWQPRGREGTAGVAGAAPVNGLRGLG
jgi:MFS family permease